MTTLTATQKYSLATALATTSLATVLARLPAEYHDFARQLDKHYAKRVGFIPRKVLALIK